MFSCATLPRGRLKRKRQATISGPHERIPRLFDSLDEAWEAHRAGGPVQKTIDTLGEATVREVIDAVLTTDRKPDGKYRQDNVMRFVLAARA